MTIRKAGIFAGSILIILFLVSCATTQKTAETDSELIILGSEQNPNKLAKNQMLSVTQRVDKPRLLEVTNWSKVRILSDLLDAMKGHSDFSNDEKYTLLTYIFDNLPISGNDGVVREVYIGKFFNNGDPLIIRIAVFTPNAEMAKINEKAIVLMTNIVNLPNDQSNRERGGFVNLDTNASMFCVLTKGLLTNGQKMSKDNGITDDQIGAADSIGKVMIAQAYLHDEIPANDSIANETVTTLIREESDNPVVKVMAMMMKYEYLLSIEDIEAADSLWKEILQFSEQVPGDMNPENLEQLNGAALFQMKKLLGK